MTMDSRDAEHPFQASFLLELLYARRCAHPRETALSAVRLVVEPVCRAYGVTAVTAAQQDVRAAVARLVRTDQGGVVLRSADVRLGVAPDVMRLAAQHAQARAEQDRADEILHREIDRANRFRAHVLQSRSSAMAYWAMHHREMLSPEALNEIKRVVDDMIDEERCLEPWREVAHIISTFVADLDAATKRTLLETLARHIDQFSNGLAGERLRTIAAALPD